MNEISSKKITNRCLHVRNHGQVPSCCFTMLEIKPRASSKLGKCSILSCIPHPKASDVFLRATQSHPSTSRMFVIEWEQWHYTIGNKQLLYSVPALIHNTLCGLGFKMISIIWLFNTPNASTYFSTLYRYGCEKETSSNAVGCHCSTGRRWQS